MKHCLLLMLVLLPALAVPVQFVKSNPELAPRGDVHFLYTPSEFTPATLDLGYSVGRTVSPPSGGFVILGSDPVTVNNGVFTLAVYPSGEVQVIVGSRIASIEPRLFSDGTIYPASSSTVQVFPGSKMAYVLWQPFNSTFKGFQVARVWYGKPWIELDTVVSAEDDTVVDVQNSISGINTGSLSADHVRTILKSGPYDGLPSASTIIPTEGWVLAYDGNDGFGMSTDADSWTLTPSGNDLDIVTHESVVLQAGMQKRLKSFFQVMSYNLDFRSSQARHWGGWTHRFDTTGDWSSGTTGRIEAGDRGESASFYLGQPAVNATIASISFEVSAFTGSAPRLQCSLNNHPVFDTGVSSVGMIVREIPVRWLEWGSNAVSCYSDGGDVIIPNIYLSLAAVEGMSLVYGGDAWRYTSVGIISNATTDTLVDLDMRDLGISRDHPTIVVLDSALNRVGSVFTYPVLSFNTTLQGNVTNSFFVAFGDGDQLILSGPSRSGSVTNYTAQVFETGSFGPSDVFHLVHREGRVSKKTPGSETGGAKTFFYDEGAGALFSLVVWR